MLQGHHTLPAMIGSLVAISRKPRTGLWVPAGAEDSPETRACVSIALDMVLCPDAKASVCQR